MADYSIGSSSCFINLINGTTYQFGREEMDAYNYTRRLIDPPEFYMPLLGGNFLNGLTIEQFIDADALSGTYQGETYTGTNYIHFLRIPFTSGKYIDICMKVSITSGYNYIDYWNVAFLDNAGVSHGGWSGSIGMSLIESGDKNFFWVCLRKLSTEETFSEIEVNYGARRQSGSSSLLNPSEVITLFNDNVSVIGKNSATFSMTQTIGGEAVVVTPTKTADTSETEGGDGDYDNTSNTITFPDLPTLSAVGSGILTLWNPSISELASFSNYLWSNDVFDTIKKFISSPMELIVSLAIVPVAPPISTTATHICIGGIDTGVSSHKLTSQYMTFDCGSINVNEYYGNALDYGVYTRISIYLPYIGVRELKSDEIMGGTIQVKYNIDLATGSCVALIKCTRQMLESVLYSFEGNLSAQIPLSSRDFSSMYASLARAVIDTAVTGGVGTAVDAVGSAMSVMSAKPNMTRSGSISSNGGHLGLHTPYLIIERPIQSLPENAGQFYGYPSNITATLGSLSGYTEIQDIIETNIHCLDEELAEIDELLKEGVYL